MTEAKNKTYAYLDTLPRPLDESQLAICCRSGNTIAAAGAGSGKTQVLATRFAWLVMSEGIDVSKILTLTFTKKAAGEMYERIYATLRFFEEQLKGGDFATEHRRAKLALEAFAGAHIQTLDSYCTGIVRQAANRYGIRPDFSTDDKGIARQLRQAALPFVLSRRTRLSVQVFADPGRLQDFAETKLAGTVLSYSSIADPAAFFSGYLDVQCRIVAEDLRYLLLPGGERPALLPPGCKKLSEHCADIQEAYAGQKEEAKQKYAAYYDFAAALCTLLEESAQLPLQGLTAEGIARRSEEVRAVCRLLARIIDCVRAEPGISNTRDAVRKQVHAFRDNTCSCLSAMLSFMEGIEAVRDFFLLLDEFSAEARTLKLSSGKLSFRDVQKTALRILREQPDICAQEQAAYDKIMIDEFQDNNGENRDLLFLLAGKSVPQDAAVPRAQDISDSKLFFVGDEKQSIYKFRGADVSVFNSLQRDFAAYFPGSVSQMTNNYRSTPQMLSSFNRLFGGDSGIFDGFLLPEEFPFEAQYRHEATKPHEALPALTKETVPLHFCVVNTKLLEEASAGEEELLDAKDMQACFIAQKVRAILDTQRQPGIAILDRSRTDRNIITRWLNLYGIRYTVDAQKDIFSAGPVCDIYNFLRCCVYPSDTNAYCAYLCSPLAGLSVQSAAAVMAALTDSGKTDFDPLAGTEQAAALLSPEEAEKFRAAQDFFRSERSRTLSRPLTDTVQLLWDEAGYRYETVLGTAASLCAEQYDMLFELARACDGDGRGVAWFVDQLASIRDKESSPSFGGGADEELDVKEVSYPLEKDADVQIMTVHKSKGLQFDYVFIWGCMGLRSKSEDSSIFFDEASGLSVKPEGGEGNYFFLRQKHLARCKEVAEARRLIYVAVTRAISEAYVLGSMAPPKEKPEASAADDFKLLEKQLVRWYPLCAGSNVHYAEGEMLYEEGAPFSYTSLAPQERRAAYAAPGGEGAGQEERRARLQAEYAVRYSGEPDVSADPAPLLTVKPSRLERETGGVQYPASASAEHYACIGSIIWKNLPPEEKARRKALTAEPEADPDSGDMAARDGTELPPPYFVENDFGTIVHAYLEAAAKGISPEHYSPELRLFKGLPEADIKVLCGCCVDMAQGFLQSVLGQQFLQARQEGRFFRAEYRFVSVLQERLVNGSIDLLFQQADGSYTIVDYKSDKGICAGKYLAQQKCYRLAAARLLGIPEAHIHCYLFFLCYGQPVDISAQLDGMTESDLLPPAETGVTP